MACLLVFGMAACSSGTSTGTTTGTTAAPAAQDSNSNAKHFKFAYAFANMDENNMQIGRAHV